MKLVHPELSRAIIDDTVDYTEWIIEAAESFATFVEIGPGRTLAGFLRKINRDVAVYNVAAWEDVDKVAEMLSGK